MHILRVTAFILLHSSWAALHAAPPPPELTILRTQYEKMLAERVTAPYEAALARLNTSYTGGLDRAITAAKKDGKLETVLALEEEKKRLAARAPIPESDEQTPEELKKMRPIYLDSLAKLAEQRVKNHSAFLPAYTKRLKELETILTKADRVDEAREIMAYRQTLAEDPAAAPSDTPPAATTKPVAAKEAKGPKGDDRKAAEWLLRNNTKVTIKTRKGATLILNAGEAPPKEDFEIVRISQPAPAAPPFTAEDVVLLNNLRSLNHIQLYTAPVGKHALEALKGSTELDTLYPPNDTSLTNEVLASLTHWPKLRSLSLNGCKGITNDGIRIIAETRPEIGTLGLRDTSIDDGAIPDLLKLKDLEELLVDGTGITQAGLEKLAGLRELSSLHLSGGPMSSPLDFTAFKKLKKLKISKSVSDALFLSLGKFPSGIEELWVENVPLTEDQLAILASGKGLKKIIFKSLVLPPTQLASFAAIAKVPEVSFYQDDSSLNDECLMQLSRIKSLKTVSLGKGTTPAGVEAFKQARKDVQVLSR